MLLRGARKGDVAISLVVKVKADREIASLGI